MLTANTAVELELHSAQRMQHQSTPGSHVNS